jgi:hypothetical protein
MTDWTTNSSEALHLSLGISFSNLRIVHELRARYAVRAAADKEVIGDNESHENFHPFHLSGLCP